MLRARRPRGRHARAGRLAGARRAQAALGGAVVLGVLTLSWIIAADGGRAPRAAVIGVPVRPVQPVPVVVAPVPAQRGTGDATALAYLRSKNTAYAAHVGEIVWTGPMLRVYTDLPASQADSKTAIALCETAAAYLTAGGHNPMVFVHAGKVAGYPVLANKMDARDDCRLNTVP